MKSYERYRTVRREPIVRRIVEALESCGARVVAPPNPRQAPFELTIELRDGGRLDLVCYAFLAEKYGQGGRPQGEHRFQLKYGSDFQRYHEIFIDPTRARVTLMFGVHLQAGLFVAVDPAMHNPTWFSMSVEFKQSELQKAQRLGWHAWERERSDSRRKNPRPQASQQTEVILAFRPEHFLRYVEIERIATGMEAGERLALLTQRNAGDSELQRQHALERTFGLTANEILDAIWGRKRLTTAVRGSVAEIYLARHLEGINLLTGVRLLDQDSKPDFELRYRGQVYTVECKTAGGQTASGLAKVDFQKTRASKADPCSRYYKRNAFDVLAACLYPVTKRWEFQFCPTVALPAHRRCAGRLSPQVCVDGEDWSPDVLKVLDICRRS